MRSNEEKNHQNPSTKKKIGPPGKPPNLKDVNIPRVKLSETWPILFGQQMEVTQRKLYFFSSTDRLL